MIESLRKLEKAFGGSVRVTMNDAGEDSSPPAALMTDTRADEGIGAIASAASETRTRGMRLKTLSTPLPPENSVSLSGLAATIADRMIKMFLPNGDGYRPIYGPRGTRKAELYARDPHWRDLVLFHEYFNGDTGEGLGASHQTGWTGLIANLIDEWRMQ